MKEQAPIPAFSLSTTQEVSKDKRVTDKTELNYPDLRRAIEATLRETPTPMVSLDNNGIVLMWNAAAEELLGWKSEEVIGKPYPCIPPGGDEEFGLERQRLCQGEFIKGFEVQRRRKDGFLVEVNLTISPLTDENGRVYGSLAVMTDTTTRKRQEARIQYLAMHDPVTNLANRRAFKDELHRCVQLARDHSPGWLLLIDLDNFKILNDTAGHSIGDDLLVIVANIIRSNLHGEAFIARIGGDEFAVIFADESLMLGLTVAERIRQSIEDFRYHVSADVYTVSVSIGLTSIDGTLEAYEAMALADSALYAAKEAGKNRIVEFGAHDQKQRAAFSEASYWLVRIKDALRDNLFELHYQPIMTTSNQTAGYYEALLRMRNSNNTLHAAGEFLPFAERFGLMPQIDQWVIRQAANELLANPQLKLFVNISGQSLQDDYLLETIELELLEHRDIANRITLEITETAAVTHLSQLQHWISRLQSIGCAFALDDFGTGFSSFAYLRSLAVDYVKIDRSFMASLGTDPADQVFIKAMHFISKSLGKTSIAEGVETEDALRTLQYLGIPYAQGYYWGKPKALQEHETISND